jgi:hypothetical protein
MGTTLRRLLILCLAAALFVGATVQLLPTPALADMGVHSGQMGGCDEPATPPAKRLPNCIDHFGCLTVPALPVSPTALVMPVRWISVAYVSGAASLPGQSIKPELSPPILTV